MARSLHMTYVPDQKRWIKSYKGKSYGVSCKQLGCPASKEASWLAANSWWESKQAELDAIAEANAPKHSPATKAIIRLAGASSLSDLHGLIERGQAATKLLLILESGASQRGVEAEDIRQLIETLKPGESIDNIFDSGMRATETVNMADVQSLERFPRIKATYSEDERLARLNEISSVLAPQVTPGDTISQHIEQWLALLDAKVQAGRISQIRRKSYGVEIGRFRDWIGGGVDVHTITEPTVTGFFAHLGVAMREGRFKEGTARLTFMSFRQFVSYLAESRVIPMPLNLRSKQFTFGKGGAKKIVTFTDEEVSAMLAETAQYSPRMRLYLLLMLNCGMYQADISDLGREEVDLEEGTITRKRSKRRFDPEAQEVTYKLWPETLALLKQFKAKQVVRREDGQARFLLTEEGNPLCMVKGKRYDSIRGLWDILLKRVKMGRGKSILNMRKTASTKLQKDTNYKFYAQYFLAQAPDTVADQSYVIPDDKEFFAACEWLGKQFLGEQ